MSFGCAFTAQDLGDFKGTVTDDGLVLLGPHRYPAGMAVYPPWEGPLEKMKGKLYFRSEYAGFYGEEPETPFTTGKPKYRWGCTCGREHVVRSERLARMIESTPGSIWLED